MNYVIILTGETPSKKNSRINTRSGRSFPSTEYKKWNAETVAEIKRYAAEGKIKPVKNGESVKLTVTFYHGDNRRRDSDNQLSSILDTLVDAGILIDDNWRVVPHKEIFDVFDEGNSHCVVSLEIGKE